MCLAADPRTEYRRAMKTQVRCTGQGRLEELQFCPVVFQILLTRAAIFVSHVDVDVRAESQHGADDVITALPRGPHECGSALQIRFIFHRWMGEKHANCLLHVHRKTTAFY